MTNDFALSPVTESLVRAAGWTPDRQTDISTYVKSLAGEGYTIPTTVSSFLSSFGGLRVRHPHHRVPGTDDSFHFDPIRAVSRNFKENIDAFADRIGRPVVPVGEAFTDYMVLLMSADGRFFAGLDDLLVFVGNDPAEALETLCTGKEMPELR
jgi:hypothetical protein